MVVKVWNPTDKGPQPRGKQVSNPEGIWYTPVSGIWQTVWMEPVAGKHIENLRITPDIDRNMLTVKAELNKACPSDFVEVNVYDGNQLVATGKSINAEPVEVSMPRNAKLWSPDSPFLYTLKVTLKSGGKVVDKVNSYAAMRKYSTRRDADGIVRLELNNEALFQFGPLDQGWWPDGLYTAPTDEALLYDVQDERFRFQYDSQAYQGGRTLVHTLVPSVSSYGRICRAVTVSDGRTAAISTEQN